MFQTNAFYFPKFEEMKRVFKEYKFEVIGGIIGTIAGWCYWYFVGCSSGSCAITSSPLNSSLYGALMGGLLAGTFKKEKKEENTNQQKTGQ